MTTYEIDAPLPTDGSMVPAGLVLTSKNNPDFLALRTDAGWVDTNNSWHEPHQSWRADEFVVKALPLPRKDTLTQFVQRFKTTTLGASYANSINIDQVTRALTAIGCDDIDTPLSPGMVMHYSDRTLMDRLPNGTIFRAGHGDIWALQGWYVKHRGALQHIMGPVRTTGHDLFQVYRIPEVDGPLPWVTEEYDESMQPEIDAFKDRAYELGQKAKQSHSWCGQYEVAMARLGIDDAWANRPRPVNAEDVKGMPVGTALLRYDPEDHSRYAFYKRADDGDETWGLSVLHTSVEEWATPDADAGLVVVQDADLANLRARVVSVGIWASLPVGSIVRTRHHLITRVTGGWTEQPQSLDGSSIITNLRDYMPYVPAVTHFGDGVWRMGATIEASEMDEQPDGTTVAVFESDPNTYRFVTKRDGEWVTLIEGSVTTEGVSIGRRVVGVGGEGFTVAEWRWLDWLPMSTIIVDPRNRETRYRKTARGWVNTSGRNSAIAPRDFAGSCRSGRIVVDELPEGEIDPRIGQPLTRDMIETLPVGSTLYGTRSGSLYTVTETGVLRAGRRSEQAWADYMDAVDEGRLVVDTIAGPITDVEWTHGGFALGQRLTVDDAGAANALPPGSEIVGLVSRNIYTRIGRSGWVESGTGNHYPDIEGFSPSNCVVHAFGSLTGDGTVAERSTTEPSEYTR